MPRLRGLDSLADLEARDTAARELLAQAQMLVEREGVAQTTKELCAMMVAGLNFCTPLLVECRGRARRLGVRIEKLNAIWDNARSDFYDVSERAALAAAVALTREPRGLPDPIWDQLRSHYKDEQIVEILTVIAIFNGIARIGNALAVEVTRSREPELAPS